MQTAKLKLVERCEHLFLADTLGYYAGEDELRATANELEKTADRYGNKIPKWNEKLDKKFAKSRKNSARPSRIKRHVYIFECGGKYKIGVSGDLERRLHDLDERPFPMNLVCHSELLDNAFTLEAKIKKLYQNYQIREEWFNLTDKQLDEIKQILKEAK